MTGVDDNTIRNKYDGKARLSSSTSKAALLAILAVVAVVATRRQPIISFFTRSSYELSTTFDGVSLYTPQQLYRFANRKNGRILLALAGSVFDVSHGKQHYGRAGGYPFFAGRDATRSFVTGDFKNDLNDDISDFTPAQHAEVLRWREFYENHKHYTFVGKVIGRFYDETGRPTDLLREMEQKARAHREQQATDEEQQRQLENTLDTPLCDVSWSAAEGGWVHCEKGNYPRRMAVAVGADSSRVQERCFCFDTSQVTSTRMLYDGCSPDSNECQTSPPS